MRRERANSVFRQMTGHIGREEAKEIQIREFVRFNDAKCVGQFNYKTKGYTRHDLLNEILVHHR
jgi:hypothetical protein